MPAILSAFVPVLCLVHVAMAASAPSAVQVTPPSAPPTDAVTAVYGNFFGISFELSFINYYFGNDTSSIPEPMLNYLSALHQRGSGRPVRLRLGGNSMDSSTYVPGQPQIIQFTDPNANVNDQPVNYGSTLFDVMKQTSDKIGAQWLIGTPYSPPVNILQVVDQLLSCRLELARSQQYQYSPCRRRCSEAAWR